MGQVSEFFRKVGMVEVTQHVEKHEGVKEGKPWSRRSQVGYLCQVDEFGVENKRRVRVDLSADQAPYAPGPYVLDGSSLDVGKYGDLEIRRFDRSFLRIPDAVLSLVNADSKRDAG